MKNRIKDFRNLGLGLFIHYGLYSKMEKGEWYLEMNKMSEERYYNLIGKDFQLKANFKNLIPFFKKCQIKYIVLTAKHHDGFCLFDSKGQSKYDIGWLNTKKDVIEEFINECHKNDIKPFIYYATMEWTQDAKNFSVNVEKIYNNVKNLLTKYKEKISGFWFDGNWSEKNKDWKLDKLYSMIRKYNKNCIIINNTGLEEKGQIVHEEIDSVTFEQGKEEEFCNFKNCDIGFEICYSINDHWGYSRFDFNFKPLSSIISDYVSIRKNYGNLLLNIGLDKNGNLGNFEKWYLSKIGTWIKENKNCLNGEIRCLYNDKYISLIENVTQNKYFIIVRGLNSGGHVETIHYGSQKNVFSIKYFLNKEIKKIRYLDNNKDCYYNIEKNELNMEIESFEYGTNYIVRLLEMECE
ncbi:alpha-L-fucosidase [Spiroplasma endosymbiont of Aspidapion aeneum]|uniref:alpha-L-fucosidase n=1 Tax=Spiroplasma endosymbiont of Aspidapion aeneum TaxID=3066276 RepID=UPI00313C577A